jgi:DNA-binding Lrp family transcriptional regulator
MAALDDVDRAILLALQDNARYSNIEISDQVDVSASTVGKRLDQLESREVIKGYTPTIDYEAAGFPFHVLFVCTAPIAERERTLEAIREIDGVVSILDTMVGSVFVQVIGASIGDVTRAAVAIDDRGLAISDELLVREEFIQPPARSQSITD